jgi:hypothetical protein
LPLSVTQPSFTVGLILPAGTSAPELVMWRQG